MEATDTKSSTKRRYTIRYRDDRDQGCPIFSTNLRAWSREDAEEQFSERGDGWEIISITESEYRTA